MVEKRLGFAPPLKPEDERKDGLVVVTDENLVSMKTVLEEALADLRTREGSMENDTAIELTRDLLGRFESVSGILAFLDNAIKSGLVVPGQDEFERTKKKRLGFAVPGDEDAGNER